MVKIPNLWFIIALCILLLVTVMVLMFEESVQVEQKIETGYLSPVSVVHLKSQDHQGLIHVFAEVEPRWSVTLTAQVSGEITKIYDNALSGSRVKKGSPLLNIEESPYLAELHEAEQLLAEAEMGLLQQETLSVQAKQDWQRSGLEKAPSDLALNKPQLKVARKRVIAARSHAEKARKFHSYTRVKAPFSGIVTARHISIGQSVAEGDPLLHILHQEHPEIAVSLSRQQWYLLAEEWRGQLASVQDTAGVEVAKARITRGGGFLDPETRQYRLFLKTLGKEAVLTGEFVQVVLPGRIVSNSLAIPESALTRDGKVWYLDDDDRLRTFLARVRFHNNNQIIIDTPTADTLGKYAPSQWRIATTPMVSFLTGNRVKPMPVESE